MNVIGKRIRKLRQSNKMSQKEFGKIFDLAESTIGMYERDERKPDYETLSRFADYFNVSTDYLLGREAPAANALPDLTEKEERDIAKDLEKMLNALDSKDGYAAFDGRDMGDMDEEDRELLRASLENSLRLAKRMAKQKFTPKKYR